MIAALRPVISQAGKHFKEHLEVEILFIPNYPDELFRLVVVEFPQSGPQILSDVNTGPIRAEHHLGAHLAHVTDDSAIFPFGKDPLFKSLLYHILTQQIGLALKVSVVKVDPHTLVSFSKSGKDP